MTDVSGCSTKPGRGSPKREGIAKSPFISIYLNNSTLANGSADHGRKRFSVNFVS